MLDMPRPFHTDPFAGRISANVLRAPTWPEHPPARGHPFAQKDQYSPCNVNAIGPCSTEASAASGSGARVLGGVNRTNT